MCHFAFPSMSPKGPQRTPLGCQNPYSHAVQPPICILPCQHKPVLWHGTCGHCSLPRVLCHCWGSKRKQTPQYNLWLCISVRRKGFILPHPLVGVAGLAILSGDHSSVLAPEQCPSPEGLTQLHSGTIVLLLVGLRDLETQ